MLFDVVKCSQKERKGGTKMLRRILGTLEEIKTLLEMILEELKNQ